MTPTHVAPLSMTIGAPMELPSVFTALDDVHIRVIRQLAATFSSVTVLKQSRVLKHPSEVKTVLGYAHKHHLAPGRHFSSLLESTITRGFSRSAIASLHSPSCGTLHGEVGSLEEGQKYDKR
jgi:hypothetical protein